MSNRTAWTGGNGQGLTWGTLINATDIATGGTGGLPTGWTVLGTPVVANGGTNLDQFMDISVRLAIGSSTIAAGANIALWLYALLDDAATYGDGQLVAGTGKNATPTFSPIGTVPLLAMPAQTNLVGFVQGIIIPPGSFSVALQNNSGFVTSGATQTVKYRTYNQQLNN